MLQEVSHMSAGDDFITTCDGKIPRWYFKVKNYILCIAICFLLTVFCVVMAVLHKQYLLFLCYKS